MGLFSLEVTPAGHAGNIVTTGELIGVGMVIPLLETHKEERSFMFPFFFLLPDLP